MVWFYVDDQMPDSREVRKLGADKLAAMGLWTLAGSWAAGRTDGFVPTEIIVQRWDPDEKAAQALVRVGMWEQAEQDGEPGYVFTGKGCRLRTRVEVEDERAAKSEAGRLGGIASGHSRRRGKANRDTQETTPPRSRRQPKARAEADASTEGKQVVEAGASSKTEAGARTPIHSFPIHSSPLLPASTTPTRVVAEALGLSEDDDETTKIVDFVRDNLKPTALGPYLRTLAANGDLADIQRQLRTPTAPVDERVYSGPTHDYDPDPSGLSCTRCDMPRKHAAHRHLRPVEATG